MHIVLGIDLAYPLVHPDGILTLALLALHIRLIRQQLFGSLADITHTRKILFKVFVGRKAVEGIQHADLIVVETSLQTLLIMFIYLPHTVEGLRDERLTLINLLPVRTVIPALHRIEILHGLIGLNGAVRLCVEHQIAHHRSHSAIRRQANPVDKTSVTVAEILLV